MKPVQASATRVFVGRETELRTFAATVAETSAPQKRSWFFTAQEVPLTQPRVFLVHGSGGMGKSCLLQKFADECKPHPASWILVNWDVAHDSGNMPDAFPAFLLRLYQAISELAGPDAEAAFEAFLAVREHYAQVEKKVDQAREKLKSALISTAAMAGGSALGKAVPVPGAEKVIEAGLAFTLQKGGEFLHEFGDSLRGFLSADDYNLVMNPNEAYASKFVEGLGALAEDKALFLAQDTYEWIQDAGRLDSLFRTLVVRPALAKFRRLGIVIAGRGDLGEEYRRTFAAEPGLLYAASIGPFDIEETRKVLEARGAPASAAEEVQRETRGVPLVVDLMALHKAMPPDEQPAPLATAKTVNAPDVIELNVMRFLRYSREGPDDAPEVARKKVLDRHSIYALALLRVYDAGAIAACWGALDGAGPLPRTEVDARMQDLRRRQEFLFEGNATRMQSLVRDSIRDYLRREMDPERGSLERDVVRTLNSAAQAWFEQVIARREVTLALPERAEDPEWSSACLSALHHQLWLEPAAALRTAAVRVLEAGNARASWLAGLLADARRFPIPDRPLLEALSAGVASLQLDKPDPLVVLTMWDAIGTRLGGWKRPPVYRALLGLNRGRTLGAAKRAKEGARELKAGLDVLPPGEQPELCSLLSAALAGCASVLLLGDKDYRAALDTARDALQYQPDDKLSLNVSVMALMAMHDYVEAEAVLSRLIDLYPGASEFRWSRVTLLGFSGKDAEAQQELREIARTRPDLIKQAIAQTVSLFGNPEVRKSVMEWGVEAGWRAQDAQSFEELLTTATPEAFGDLQEAYFRVIAEPGPEASLAVCEVLVKHFSNRADLLTLAAVNYVTLGRPADAVSAFERAEELAPDAAETTSTAALALFLRGHLDEALPFLKRACQKLPGNAGPPAMLTECYLQRGQLAEARETVETALRTLPSDPVLRFSYGLVLRHAGEPERGWSEQREAFLAAPQILETSRQGLLIVAGKGLDRVKQSLRSEMGAIGDALADLPQEDMARLCTEVLRASLESDTFGGYDREVMVAVLEELLRARPDVPDIRFALAEEYEAAGSREKAIAVLEELALSPALPHVSPESRDVRRVLTRIYLRADDQAGALRHLRQAPEPFTAPELRALASLHETAGQIDLAVEAYNRAESLEPDSEFDALLKFGQYNAFSGHFAEADAQLRKAVALQPASTDALLLLAYSSFEQGRFEEARTGIEQALQLEPGSSIAHARLYRVLLALGRNTEAGSAKEKAIAGLASTQLYNQACVLALIDRPGEAFARLNEVLAEDPGVREWAMRDPDVRDLLRQSNEVARAQGG